MKHIYFCFAVLTAFISSAQIPPGYYDAATGTGFALKTQLKNIIDDVNDNNGQPFHDNSVTYSQLWTLYETSDVRPDGKVWDMYSDCNFTFVVDQDMGSGGGSECSKFNREHSFPRSWFDDQQSLPIFADAFHVIPSDKKVNAERGNLAYGEVASASYTSLNGSKRGSSSITGPTGQVFEPADEFKGDIARGFFYVATRYENLISGWEANDSDGDSMLDGSSNRVFEQWALDMLYSWHVNDPVSQKEIDRNNAIFLHQDNRNPFIDNPQYVFDIWQDVLSVDEFDIAETFKMFPNPASENEVTILSNRDIVAEIYDILGKRISVQIVTANQNKLNISNLSKGMYIIRLKSDQNSSTKKLIKQ
ncbi:Por secretion system C-terminal sorting domain-containing protein [Formosa sp. Hel1_31_208]|uniref:endonuclease n=1 Tax=Formosa sp. Hel1_31_208 TaxID=1798225 RepID=UPI00087A9358|nr:endonuclease [Formosa sp. Hel1_31_208]SDS65156.1 Por secretion system C-terminal sorting domain-containing protein [Formosa sp. Hel1_31_208]